MADPASTQESVSLPFDQVVSLCEDFTGAWEPGRRPDIPSYLLRAAGDARETLLVNLLQNEIQRRRLLGETPLAEEYIGQLPAYAPLVRKVFLESTSAGSGSRDDSATRTAHFKPPAATRLGDYRLLRELGRGGMGVVYEAVHVNRGNRVALKLLPQVDGARLYRFKREFRSAADLSHPNLIGLHSLEADGGQWFFTMDLIHGVDFLEHVRPSGQLDEARLRPALSQLALGVMALHRNHIIHRDLKPSNVMVADGHRVILLDFGLVLELEQASLAQSSQGLAGTPSYMAPEQAAGGAVTPSADWYAVGVMLYEALSGHRPFSGSVWEVIRAKQQDDPAPLPADLGLPEDLVELCQQLLARDPRQRPDVLEITRRIASDLPTEPTGPIAQGPGGPHLVGRAVHLEALDEMLRALRRQGGPQTGFLAGRSGEGKSTLAEHFLAGLREDKGLAVMGGRCYDRESVPFKALDSLIDTLASYLRALPVTDAALLMPDDIGVLAHVFPVLQRVEVVARAAELRTTALDEQQVRQRAFSALRSLLFRIGRKTPIIWFIDDLQWGDVDSADALFEVLRPPSAPQVLFLGAYRSDETEGSPFLNAWKELQRKHDVRFADREVKLAPLTLEECIELIVGLIGQDNPRIRERAVEFARETRGNPLLLTELVGCFDPEADSFEPVPLHELLDRKLARLPDEAAPFLDVIAVSGQAILLGEASRVAGHLTPPIATLTRMRNERLIRLVGPDDRPQVDTYHDRVRETILGRLDPESGRAIHRTIAEVIEADAGIDPDALQTRFEGWEHDRNEAMPAIPRIYDLAYHFDAAGERRKAWIYGLYAAEQARRQSALEVAVNNFAIARRNADPAHPAVLYRISKGAGGTLSLLGRYEEARRELRGAIELADDPVPKARIELIEGEILFKQGTLDRSVEVYESGLRRLGLPVPRTTLGFAASILRGVVVQAGHTLRPGRLHRSPPSARNDLAVILFGRLGGGLAFQNTIKMVWSILEGMNRAELTPPTPQLTFTYAFQACMMSMLGWTARGSRYGLRAQALAGQFDDLWSQGHCSSYQGIGDYASARYEKGLAHLVEAIAAFEKAGDLWEVNLSHFHKGCCHFGLGNLAEAIAEARWTFAAAARLNDARVFCSSWLWARATRGNLPFDELRGCYPNRPDDIMSTVHGKLAEGYWHSFHGRTEQALQTFESAAATIRKTLCVNSHTILVVPMLAMGLRLHADAIQATDPRQAGALRKRARRVARWATRHTSLFPAAYPVALRERALALAASGQAKQALKFADQSCAIAEAQKAKYEHALSLQVRGQIARQLGLPGADEQIRQAEASIEALERPLRPAQTAAVE